LELSWSYSTPLELFFGSTQHVLILFFLTLPNVPQQHILNNHLLFQQPLYISKIFSNFTHPPPPHLATILFCIYLLIYIFFKWKKSIAKRETPCRKSRGTGVKIQFLSFPKISLCSHLFPFTHGSWIHEGVWTLKCPETHSILKSTTSPPNTQ
jgi:hypothetical protein